MRLDFCSCCLAAALLAVNASPNAAATPSVQATTAQAEQKPTTIVGCLVQGLPGPDKGVAAAQSANADQFFVRTPTVKVPAGTSVTVGSPGTTNPAASIGTPVADSFYRITGLDAGQLRSHLNQRVELQGHLTSNVPEVEATRATTTQDKDGRATTRVETRIAVAGVLHATAIKMVERGCAK